MLTPDLPTYTVGHKADWSLIPDYMIGGLRLYIEHGIPPGHFLTAVLCNDLREAVQRADDTNRRRLADYMIFLVNYAPHSCWGSTFKFNEWCEHNGLEGLANADR